MNKKTFSNRYIFFYISVLVLIVALVLSVAAVLLQPLQHKNRENEKMKQILTAAGYQNLTNSNILSLYEANTQELLFNSKGILISQYADKHFIMGNIRPFTINEKNEFYKADNNQTDYLLPLYLMNHQDGSKTMVIPLVGKGLWGPIWGFIAIAEDMNTVKGIVFSHKSETPGLGAQIETTKFTSSFEGKLLFDENSNFVSIKVVKGGVNNSSISAIHGVDAISGGTITSKGVETMLNKCLSLYLPIFTNYNIEN